MSDTQSQCGSSRSANRNKPKICGYCGKTDSANMARHYIRHHFGLERKDWVPDQPLLGQAWCSNWKDVALHGAKEVDLLPQFQKGSYANSKKGSKCGSQRASTIADAESQYQGGDDVQMLDIIQEEKKDDGAVQNFGGFERNNILGKRTDATTTSEELKNVVQVELQQQQQVSLVTALVAVPRVVDEESINPFAAKAEIQTKVSAKNLQKIPQTTTEQQLRTPSFEQEFLIPLPVPQTVYRDQGQRDQQAIQKLKLLNSKRTGDSNVQVLELIKLAPFFTQPTVSSFIELNKEELLHLKDLVLLAQEYIGDLSTEEVTAVAFVSVLFGGPCWASLPKTFNGLDPAILEEVLDWLKPLLSARFNAHLAKWICSSWRYLEDQTLPLLRFLKEEQLEISLAINILTISRMVKMAALDDYLTVTEVFLKYPVSKLVLAAIDASTHQWNCEQKLSFVEYAALVGFLARIENKYLIQGKEEELNDLPLNQWLQRLTDEKNSSNIVNVASVQFRLDQLLLQYGVLAKCYATDLHVNDKNYGRVLHQVTNAPNALQFANAQYAALSLRTNPRQMWCVPSGQGKSRILAASALILLLTGSTTKVHLVYACQYLMERDQKEFARWWTIISKEDSVEYHIGLDFDREPGDIILVDEADELILSDPAKLVPVVQQYKFICLTATPDNDDKLGVEREVLQLLGFKVFNGQPIDAEPVAATVSTPKMNELNMGHCSQELVSFIREKIKHNAVLCCCSLQFSQLLFAAKLPVILIRDGKTIDDKLLRSLDERVNPDGTHALIVTSTSFGMRGLDYRAPKNGVTLIVAGSFANQRQAMQGLNRVGRFGDPCTRFILKGVDLVDQTQQNTYTANLTQFLMQHQKKKVIVKMAAVIPSSASTTTSSGKLPIRSGNGQQNSSQTTITAGAFGKNNLNKHQTRLVNAIGKPQLKKKEKEEEIVVNANPIY